MIRDPSDGTVRNPLGESPLSHSEQSVCEPRAPVSGLREPSRKSSYLARLEKSREWLKNYHSKSTSEESNAQET